MEELDLVSDFDHIDPPEIKEPRKRRYDEVGNWVLHDGSLRVIFPMYRKPRWLTRFMMKWCFEILWEDSIK